MEKDSTAKHGKARPWLLWWCIPFAVSLVLMFTAPDFGTTGKIIYAFLTYNLAVTVVYTAINLPFGSLAALMTKNQTERGYLNISKMVFACGGMVVNAATLSTCLNISERFFRMAENIPDLRCRCDHLFPDCILHHQRSSYRRSKESRI